MGYCKGFLMTLRVLAVIMAMAVVGLGAWMKVIIDDIEIRGFTILDVTQLQPQSDDVYFRNFFNTVLGGDLRMLVTIGASSLASFLCIFVLIATVFDRMRISVTVLVSMEAISMCAMATAFATSLSFALSVDAFSPNRLNTAGSTELILFAMTIPLSKGLNVAAGSGWFVVLVAFIVATVSACNRRQVKEICFFEPNASSLGMGHGPDVVMPITVRSRVPTMYLPGSPLQEAHRGIIEEGDEETRSFATEGREMARSDSALSQYSYSSRSTEIGITALPKLKKPQDMLQVRPGRPWSELRSPKRRDDVIHAL
ncbi:hypothetical protein ACN47E_008510 [Coniothyrium glycines]